MYTYWIYPEPNMEKYRECVDKLKQVLEVLAVTELHDVDDSHFSILQTPEGKVTVKNSEYLDEVYVESDICLDDVLE